MSGAHDATGSKARDGRGRWTKGNSGNERGRPKKETSPGVDVHGILSEPVLIEVGNRKMKGDIFEAKLRRLCQKALMGDVRATVRCIKLAEKYGVLSTPERPEHYPGGAVLTIPYDWDKAVFIAMYKKHGDPPWPGERDGLIPPERRTKWNPQGLTVA